MNISSNNNSIINSDSSFMTLCRNSKCINSILSHTFDSSDCSIIGSDASMLINCHNCHVINSPNTILASCNDVYVINSRHIHLSGENNRNLISVFRRIPMTRLPRSRNLRLGISDLRGVRISESGNESECSVCQIDFNDELITILECDHKFHDNCILRWVNGNTNNSLTCPLCRQCIRTFRLRQTIS